MSGEYIIPESPRAPAVSVLPTERLQEIVQGYNRYADALIEIVNSGWGPPWWGCNHCDSFFEHGCKPDCPGLLARRALGVAP